MRGEDFVERLIEAYQTAARVARGDGEGEQATRIGLFILGGDSVHPRHMGRAP